MKDKLLDKFIRFDVLMGITAIIIALVAAFFSVYGIATLFAGAFILTAIMASSLELGKLVAVTFLYRYWKKTQSFLKIYLGIAIVVLMLITSVGIFGYLSSAYQQSSLEYKAAQEKIVMVESQIPYLNDKMAQSKIRIQTLNDMRKMQESRLNESITNAFITRNPIQFKQIQDQTSEMIQTASDEIKAEQVKIQTSTEDIIKLNKQINDMRFSSSSQKDIRTFQFVADQFGTTLDKVAKWFIFTIIFVFDPLAIALILAYNIVAYKEDSIPPEVSVPISVDLPKKELILNTTSVSTPPKEIITSTPEPISVVPEVTIPIPDPPKLILNNTPPVVEKQPLDPGAAAYFKL